MKKNVLLIFAFFLAISYHAQTVTPTILSNDGNYTSTSSGSIAWTIGEPVSDTYTNGNRITTNGFHQPNIDLVEMISEQGADKDLLVYPNPVRDEIRINFSGLPEGTYSLVLNDALGKLISKSDSKVTSTNKEAALKINEAAAGIYFLTITNSQFQKTVKINKVY